MDEGAVKVVLRGIFMALKGLNINNISFQLKKLEKERANQTQSKQKEGNNEDPSRNP